jgi:tryptophanyl-tRNA synthetase
MTTMGSDPSYRGGFDEQLLAKVATARGYQEVPSGLSIGRCADSQFLTRRFIAHYNATALAQTGNGKAAIVTGFGPTNAPTAGTLSAMLTACELQRRSGLHTTIVISDLGAWNSRNLPWGRLEEYRDQMLAFIAALGFDHGHGILRSHQDKQNLILSGRIARFLNEQDFRENRESLDELYQGLGIRGPQFGVMVDGLYTLADILGPLRAGRERVLMLAGIEEHYFTDLARLVLARCREHVAGEIFSSGAQVAALFLGVVPGLAGHEKMSKSIPESAIRLDEPPDQIKSKITEAEKVDDPAILRMIELASTWPDDQITDARDAFRLRFASPRRWDDVKRDYAGHLAGFGRLWQS